jgi:hypothetical protein
MTPYLWASQVYNSFFRGKIRKASFFRGKTRKTAARSHFGTRTMTPYLWASQVYNSFFRGKTRKASFFRGKTRKASFFREKHENLLLAATSEHVS